MYVFTQTGVGFNMNGVENVIIEPTDGAFELVAYTVIDQRLVIGSYDTEESAQADFRQLKIALTHGDHTWKCEKK